MFEKLRVVFTIPELRQKILLTLLFLAIYRVGWQIPLPVVDTTKPGIFDEAGGFGDFIDKVSLFSASQLSQLTIFGLGIMPYISASIIFQLLGSVWAPLERLQKEGESGRQKDQRIHALCDGSDMPGAKAGSSVTMMSGTFREEFLGSGGNLLMSWKITCVLTMTCGTVFLMWLGEQIDEFGIGNGISLLIMAGILARMPNSGIDLIRPSLQDGFTLGGGAVGSTGVEVLLVLAFLFLAVVVGVVFIYQGQRRIPTQSAKHVRGRRVYGGTRQYLPLKVNQAGVMPIIFASSLLLFPAMIFNFLESKFPESIWSELSQTFQSGTVVRLQRAVRGVDLLLLLLLDGHHLQSQGHGQQPQRLRQFHPRLPAG